MGSVAIDLGDTYRIILSRLGFPLEIGEVSKSTLAIVWNMRFPRVLLGLIVGAGLSMCGSVMQSTVNNPIAEPYVLGISAGATLGATLSIILGLKLVISLGAFLGAILATIAVLIIASMQGLSLIHIYINVAERIRELSTIKVLGFHNKEVTLYIYRETMVLSLVGIALGLVTGYYLHQFLIQMISPATILFYPRVSWEVYALPIVAVTVILALLSLFVNHRLRKVDMLEALKSVE